MNTLPNCVIQYLIENLTYNDRCGLRSTCKKLASAIKNKNLSYWIKRTDPIIFNLKLEFLVKFACKYDNIEIIKKVENPERYAKYFYKYSNRAFINYSNKNVCRFCHFYAAKNNIQVSSIYSDFYLQESENGYIAGGYFDIFDQIKNKSINIQYLIKKNKKKLIREVCERYSYVFTINDMSDIILTADMDFLLLDGSSEYSEKLVRVFNLIKNLLKCVNLFDIYLIDHNIPLSHESLILFTLGCLTDNVEIIRFCDKFDLLDFHNRSDILNRGFILAVKNNSLNVIELMCSDSMIRHIDLYAAYKVADEKMRLILKPFYKKFITKF